MLAPPAGGGVVGSGVVLAAETRLRVDAPSTCSFVILFAVLLLLCLMFTVYVYVIRNEPSYAIFHFNVT